MPKVDFAFIAHNAQPFLSLNLENIYPFANKIIIIEGPVGWYRRQGLGASTDGTLEAIASFPDPEGKIVLEQGLSWDEKDDMVRAQEKHFSGDWVCALDADEFLKRKDMKKIFAYLDEHPECHSMSFSLLSFYGGLDRYISGFEEDFEVHRLKRIVPGVSRWKTHRPPTMILGPDSRTCRELGHVDHRTTRSWGIRLYHYSHLPPKRVKHKMGYYASFSQTIPSYFKRLYIPWMRAETEEEKLAVEAPFRGVQEWLPHRRGDAYTARFKGTHPEVIEARREEIEAQVRRECEELGIWESREQELARLVKEQEMDARWDR